MPISRCWILEDAVPAAEKAAARATIGAALARSRQARAYVRINALCGADWEANLRAVVCPMLDGIVLPKVETAAELRELDARLTLLERCVGVKEGALDVMPIIESARGVWDCAVLAAATPRVRRLIFGGADYTLDLDLEWTPEEHELSFARARLAHASRVAGIEPPIDTAILQVRDAERFVRSARNGKHMGFQGNYACIPIKCSHAMRYFRRPARRSSAPGRSWRHSKLQTRTAPRPSSCWVGSSTCLWCSRRAKFWPWPPAAPRRLRAL